jgi:hypothetical protein
MPTLIKLQLSQQRHLVIKKGSITIESSEKPKIAFDEVSQSVRLQKQTLS